MQRIIVRTKDGSPTIYVPEIKEHYHSVFGAIQESAFVFINKGLVRSEKQHIKLFEIGFGTGLNACLSCLEAEKKKMKISYHSIEMYPVEKPLWIEYIASLPANFPNTRIFREIHECRWEEEVQISKFFSLKKIKADMTIYQPEDTYDVIYFDAFGPAVQPEMWTTEIFRKISGIMKPGAILSTYSSSGQTGRNLKSAGLLTERLPGPPGKREMIVAIKPVE